MKFKNEKDYQDLRAKMMLEAEEHQKNGDSEKFTAVEKAINEIDGEFDKWKNDEALKATMQSRIDGLKIDVGEGKVVEMAKPEEIKYENIFAKKISGRNLTAQEETVFENENAKYTNAAGTIAGNPMIVPVTSFNNIWTIMRETHPVLQKIEATTIAGGTVHIVDDYDGSGPANWIDEITPATDDTQKLVIVKLGTYEIVKLVSVSWAMRRLAPSEYVAYLERKVAAKVGDALAASVFTGLGVKNTGDTHTSQALGVITKLQKEAGTPQVITYAKTGLLYKDVIKAFSLVNGGFMKAIYANSNVIWNELASVVDANGRPIFIPDASANGIGKIFGCEVFEEPSAPDNTIVVGDFAKGYAMNLAQDIALFTDSKMKERIDEFMAYAIADGQPTISQAFAVLVKAK